MLVIVTKWNCYEPHAWEAEPFAAIALEEGWGRKCWYNSVQAIHSRCFGKPVAGQTCFGFGLKFILCMPCKADLQMLSTGYQNIYSTVQSPWPAWFYTYCIQMCHWRLWSSQRKVPSPSLLSTSFWYHSLNVFQKCKHSLTKTLIFCNMDRMCLVGSSMERGKRDGGKMLTGRKREMGQKSWKGIEAGTRCRKNLFGFQNTTWTSFNVLCNKIASRQISV